MLRLIHLLVLCVVLLTFHIMNYLTLPRHMVAGVTVPPPAALSLLRCREETETMTSRFHWLQLLRTLRSASCLKDEFGGDVLSLFVSPG